MNKTAKKLVIAGTIVATSLTGLSVLPSEQLYRDMALPIEIQEQYTTRSWNSITKPIRGDLVIDESWLLPDNIISVAPKVYESAVSGEQINYLSDTSWEAMDLSFRQTASGFEMTDAPFSVFLPISADGTARMVNTNRYDSSAHEEIDEPDQTQSMHAIGTNAVAGRIETGDLGFGETSYVIYPGAYSALDADLIYFVHQTTKPVLRKIVRFNTAPAADVDLQFEISFDAKVDFFQSSGKWDKTEDLKTSKALAIRKTKSKKGFSTEDYKIWNLEGKGGNIEVSYAELTGNSYLLTKHIPAAFFVGNSLPVFTDTSSTFEPVDGANSPVDGVAGKNDNNDWQTTRDALTSESANTSATNANPEVASGVSAVPAKPNFRQIITFDTAAIPDADTITSATIAVKAANTSTNTDATYIVIVQYTGSTSQVTTAEYNDFPGLTGALTEGSNQISLTITSGDIKTFTLDVDGLGWLTKTGVSGFGIVTGLDATDDPTGPSGNNTVQFYHSDHASEPAPLLTVVHASADTCTAPASGDWNVQSSDNCYVTTNTFVNGNLIILNNTGPGSFNVIDGVTLSIEGLQNTSTPMNFESDENVILKFWNAN